MEDTNHTATKPPKHYLEPHATLPLLLLPRKLKETVRIKDKIGYPYINLEVTAMNPAKGTPLTLRLMERVKIYHKIKTPSWPSAWILVYRKHSQTGQQ